MAITLILALLSVLVPTKTLGKTLTVAVIDTGIDASNPKLCKFGHKSFIDNLPLVDNHGHGTHVAGLITREAGDLNYCLISIKYYSDRNTGKQNLANLVAALRYLINIKVDYINYSGGGPEFDEQEYLVVKEALKRGIKIFAAAGNENSNLDSRCDYYPACYDKRIVMVGNYYIDNSGPEILKDPRWAELAKMAGMYDKFSKPEAKRNISSNYGKRVTLWENGTDRLSDLPGGHTGRMTGTSQATGVATGKALKARLSQ